MRHDVLRTPSSGHKIPKLTTDDGSYPFSPILTFTTVVHSVFSYRYILLRTTEDCQSYSLFISLRRLPFDKDELCQRGSIPDDSVRAASCNVGISLCCWPGLVLLPPNLLHNPLCTVYVALYTIPSLPVITPYAAGNTSPETAFQPLARIPDFPKQSGRRQTSQDGVPNPFVKSTLFAQTKSLSTAS